MKRLMALLFIAIVAMGAYCQTYTLVKYTQDLYGEAYVYLKNTGNKPLTAVSFRLIYQDKNKVDIDYADFCFRVDIEPGMTRRYQVKRYGDWGEFGTDKGNIFYRLLIKEHITAEDLDERESAAAKETAAAEAAAREKAKAEMTAAAKEMAEMAAAEAAAREKAKAEMTAAAKEKAAAEAAAREKAFGSYSSTGNPTSGVDSGTSGGHGWSVAGRLVNGTIPNTRENCYNEEGTVVVRIRVNAAGDVIEATRGQGTNTSSECLLEAAIHAAKQAKFSTGSGDVVGSITYVFKLR